jgi:hypothetical protein
MAYRIDLAASAKRHFRDGEVLLKAKSAQHAGYHFGFAAECALKSEMPTHAFPPKEDRRTDPFWAHFPELRALLVRDGNGRFKRKLYELIAHDSFMQGWDTDMRYAADHSVDEVRALKWKDQVDRLFGVIFF